MRPRRHRGIVACRARIALISIRRAHRGAVFALDTRRTPIVRGRLPYRASVPPGGAPRAQRLTRFALVLAKAALLAPVIKAASGSAGGRGRRKEEGGKRNGSISCISVFVTRIRIADVAPGGGPDPIT